MPDLGAFYGQNSKCGAGIFPLGSCRGIRHQGSPGRRKCPLRGCFSGCCVEGGGGLVFHYQIESCLTWASVAHSRWDGGGAGILREYRGRQPSVQGTGAQQPCWGQGATPIGGLRAAVLIGSRVKRLAQLELALAPIRTGYYLTQAPQVRQLRSPPASPEILKKERGIFD